MRANLKAKGIQLEESKYPSNSLGQGHNPNESPQMYIEKILRSQKRMERTIELYEENQKKKQQEEGSKPAEDGKGQDGGSPIQVSGGTITV